MIITDNPTVNGISNAATDEEELDIESNNNHNCHANSTNNDNNDDSDPVEKEGDSDGNITSETTTFDPHFVHSAVLPQLSLVTTGENAGIQAFCEVIKADGKKRSRKTNNNKKTRAEEENLTITSISCTNT